MKCLARPLIRRFGLASEIDPDDIANSALLRLWQASTSGKLPEFDDDAAFWRYAGRVVSRLVMDARTARFAARRVRGWAGGTGESGVTMAPEACRVDAELSDLACGGVIVEEAVLGSAEVERFIEALGDPRLEQTIRMRLEGFTIREIAASAGRDVGTVKRRLRRVRAAWCEWSQERGRPDAAS